MISPQEGYPNILKILQMEDKERQSSLSQ